MKIAPLMEEMGNSSQISPFLVHTGQHFDPKMSQYFFDDLGIPKPDINLEVGSKSHIEQIATIMQRFEPVVLREKPAMVLVVGDVNSTIACALTAVKLGVRVAHVEAGLRSFDRSMPEEINRVLTDAISDYLFTTEESAKENLLNEGIAPEKIHFVGNVMIDTLLKFKEKALASRILDQLGLTRQEYCLATLHRPGNVDTREVLEQIFQAFQVIGESMPVVFPCHPRTQKKLIDCNLTLSTASRKGGLCWNKGVLACDPIGYLDFMKLMINSKVVITDSGGIQEETTILEVPCLTVRSNTERPVTISHGTNKLIGNNKDDIIREALSVTKGIGNAQANPPLWDGKATERILQVLCQK